MEQNPYGGYVQSSASARKAPRKNNGNATSHRPRKSAPVETAREETGYAADSCMAEVRFEDAPSATHAISQLDGLDFKGYTLKMTLDPQSKDRTKCVVTGVPMDVDWQDLKDHFNQVPNVAFVAIIGDKRKSATGPTLTGEVRFETADQAQQAMEELQGTAIGGAGAISITIDTNSKDNSKLLVTDIPPGVSWQELKAHFCQAVGKVAYANVSPSGAGGAATQVGEVRYDDPAHTSQAFQTLNGSNLRGSIISLNYSPGSADQSKLIVHGIPLGTGWQELKDHFSQIGQVAFANVFTPKGGGKGGGGCNDWDGPLVPMMMMVPAEYVGGGKAAGGKAAGGRGGNKGQVWPSGGKSAGGYGKEPAFAKPFFNSPYLSGCGPFW